MLPHQRVWADTQTVEMMEKDKRGRWHPIPSHPGWWERDKTTDPSQQPQRSSAGSNADQASHQPWEKTTVLARKWCYWPGMALDIANYSQNCECCTFSQVEKQLHLSMGSLTAARALEVLAIDFSVLDPSSNETEHVLVLTDVFTECTQAIATRNQTTLTVTHVLVWDWFICFAVKSRIPSDQEQNLESKIIQELCKVYGVTKNRNTTNHSKGNGQCQWLKRTLHDRLRTLPPKKKQKWLEYLPEFVYAYNSSSHSSTWYSSLYHFFGWLDAWITWHSPIHHHQSLFHRSLASQTRITLTDGVTRPPLFFAAMRP